MTAVNIGDAMLYFVVFLFSTTLHEAAHAWSAKRGGDLTAYQGGQVTLDPIPHIRREPFGMVVLPLMSALLTGFPFGYASAPFNPEWARRHPDRAAWMALAGPAANMLLVIAAALAIRVGFSAGVFYPPGSVNFGTLAASDAGDTWTIVAKFLSVLFSLNLLLAAFNMLPFPPLDGSAALPLLLSRRVTARYQEIMWSTPMIGLLGLLIAWQLFDVVFHPIFLAAVNLVYPGVTYR